MADADFPSLGFDPARGNVAVVADMATQMRDTALHAEEAFRALKSVEKQEDVWTGQAARAFADNLGDLPGYLDDAQQSLSKSGKAFETWSDRLETHQKRAVELEEEARKAINDYEDKAAAAESARATAMQHPGDALAQDNAMRLVGQANRAMETTESIRKQARDLKDTWQDDARICAEALDEAR